MQSDSNRHHRHSIRLRGYDYAQAGAYFVTICTKERRLFFDDLTLKDYAEECWLAIPEHATNVELDEWVVMPNHLHGIIVITDKSRDVHPLPWRAVPGLNVPTIRDSTNPFSAISPRGGTLSVIVRTYKAAVTTGCHRLGCRDFDWQPNYYEHIIRNELELKIIRKYIAANPLKWSLDMDNPSNFSGHAPPSVVDEYLRDAGAL